jgi:hypothetical protein
MWSHIIKLDETFIKKELEDNIKMVPIVKGEQLNFKRKIYSFVKEYGDILEYIYNKYFKDYNHITKKDFYIFAYNNTQK